MTTEPPDGPAHDDELPSVPTSTPSTEGEPQGPPPEILAGTAAPPEQPPQEREATRPKKKGSFLRELPILILIAFGLALILKTFVVQAFYIPSESMLPTLQVEDRVLVNKLVYRFRDPRRGEIIVFIAEHDREERSFWQRVRSFLTEGLGVTTPAERDFIKRVVGLPGETVEVDEEGNVFVTPVDGERFRLDEPYIENADPSSFGPTTVPEDGYFVMGDNRPASSDSRSDLGAVRRTDIIGKAFVRIWPPGRFGFFRTPAYDARAADALAVLAVLPAAASAGYPAGRGARRNAGAAAPSGRVPPRRRRR
jgi:signal peptidase I